MKLVVDKASRYTKMRAHTWIHMLYWALEKVLNRKDIKQAGSFVDEDYGRLDFNADKPISYKQLKQIEELVNGWIKQAIDVEIFETSLQDAIKKWAKAFFDEKYWEKVRVIKIPWVDIQLCGGTHSPNTSFVWAFKIISQQAVASWIKRISIVTWPKVASDSIKKQEYIQDIAQKFDCTPSQILEKVEKTQKELNSCKSELENLKDAMIVWKLKTIEKTWWKFDYIINLEIFEGIDFKNLVQKVKSNLKWNILIYSKQWNFAIITETFSAKEFAKENNLKWWWNDNMVQWRDKKILEIL